jgi:NitT/TauT family transport system permease protein
MKSVLKTIVIILLTIVVWEVVCVFFSVRQFVFPRPAVVATALWEYRESLAGDTLFSLVESAAGLAVACLGSLGLGVAAAYLPSFKGPLVSGSVILKSVPMVVLAPIFLVWFGYGLTGKVLLAAIISFFPLLIGLVQGMSSVTGAEQDLFRVYRASRWQTITKLMIPKSVPFVLAGLRVSAPMAVLGSLIAETAGARRGLGVTMMVASANLNSRLLFAAAVLSATLGLLAFALVVVTESFSRRYLEQ